MFEAMHFISEVWGSNKEKISQLGICTVLNTLCFSQIQPCKELVAHASSFGLFMKFALVSTCPCFLLHGLARRKLGRVTLCTQISYLLWSARVKHNLNITIHFSEVLYSPFFSLDSLIFWFFVPKLAYLFNEAKISKVSLQI